MATVTYIDNPCGSRESPSTHLDLYEARECLKILSLQSVTLRDYLIIMRSDFDVEISGEPYVAYILVFQPRSGLYLARIWNQTVATGYATSTQQLQKACTLHFSQGRPCIGYPLRDQRRDGNRFVISQSPMPRVISKKCRRVIAERGTFGTTSCHECLDLEEKPDAVEAATAVVRAELNSNGEETSDFAQISEPSMNDAPGVMKQESCSYDDFFHPGDREMSDCRGIPVKCPWCDETFEEDSGMLVMHQKIQHLWGVFKCSALSREGSRQKCIFRGNFVYELKEHMEKSGHVGDWVGPTLFNCPRCRDMFSLSEIEAHCEECRSVSCPVCMHHFSEYEIGGHFQTCVEEAAQPGSGAVQACDGCLRKFPVAEFYQHLDICDRPHRAPGRVGPGRQPLDKEEFEGERRQEIAKVITFVMPDLSKATTENDGICLIQERLRYLKRKEQSLVNGATDSIVKCPWCEETFPWGTGLLTLHKKLRHLQMLRLGESHMLNSQYKSHHCPKCRDTFPLLELEAHFAECESIRCAVCLYQFGSADIADHYKKCVEEDVKRSKKWARFCSKCKIKFHAGEYFHHIHDCDGLKSRFLPSQPANIFDPRQGVKRQLVMAGDGTIKKLKIEEMAGRKSHIKLSKSFKVLKVLKGANNVPGAESGGSGSGPKVMVIKGPLLRRKCSDYSLSTRKRVKCTWCNKNMFENFYNLHKKRKHLWGEFRCPECAVEMFFPKDLVEHIKHHENPQETSAECPICHQKCPFEIMEAHYKSCVAEKETDVICDFCSQHVRFSNERGHNMKKHRYYGQFECPTCRIQADFAKDLAVHFRSTGHGSGRRFNRK